MRLNLFRTLLFFYCTFFSFTTSYASEKLALVIGNSAYQGYFNYLVNPHWDAIRMQDALQQLGFKVFFYENLALAGMKSAALNFRNHIDEETKIALIFYAGHGAEIDKKGFLIPTDITINKNNNILTEIESNALNTEFLFDLLKQSPNPETANILILDACRTLPSLRGLSNQFTINKNDQPANTLISFSTSSGKAASDGQSGGNSPYTKTLLKYLQQPNLDLVQIFNKTHYELKEYGQTAELSISGGLPEYILNPKNPENKLSLDYSAPAVTNSHISWVQILWNWADEFQISDDTLPRSIIDLKNLKSLTIDRREDSNSPPITYISPEIGHLKKLTSIEIMGNPNLHTIPKEIGHLENLAWLRISNNRLTYLPEEIGNLKNLKSLFLNNNDLMQLPESITSLHKLQTLWINNNINLELSPKQENFFTTISDLNID